MLMHSDSLDATPDFHPFPEITPEQYNNLLYIAIALLRGKSYRTITPYSILQDAFVSILSWSRKNNVSVTEEHLRNGIAKVLPQRINDELRKRLSGKRGKGVVPVPITDGVDAVAVESLSIEQFIDLNNALSELADFDPRAALSLQLVRLAGCTLGEAADRLNVSSKAVQRDLRAADAWMAAKASSHKRKE
jgi:DNA-directed RNA polymerase specialized sigma24 family protein